MPIDIHTCHVHGIPYSLRMFNLFMTHFLTLYYYMHAVAARASLTGWLEHSASSDQANNSSRILSIGNCHCCLLCLAGVRLNQP